ncbi:phospholipase D-like domain-containing protein [Thermus sp.]|uniref:phospholipase D-like domain-containing protein n=1 Tax=Thermus sp. TaxID=275 RepID=UPI00307E25F2
MRPRRPQGFLQDPWAYLEARDPALFHPFEDYRAVEAFAWEAALDPEVEALWATLYRIGEANALAEALIQAAREGKDVAVFLEGRARFDELQNLYWRLRFQRVGVRVLPLLEKKVHAKALWVWRGERAYAHLGTGNYNPRSGAQYADLFLFTTRPELVGEVEAFFRALEAGTPPGLRFLKTGPAIRQALVEATLQEAHPGGQVLLKCNYLTDPRLLQALEEAAEAGARVDLIVRSTLVRLHPRIQARSLVGRFLEHARLAAFRAGGRWSVWAGNADLMPRNLDLRYELFFPLPEGQAKAKVLRYLRRQLADDANAFLLLPEGERPLWGGPHSAHAWPF